MEREIVRGTERAMVRSDNIMNCEDWMDAKDVELEEIFAESLGGDEQETQLMMLPLPRTSSGALAMAA